MSDATDLVLDFLRQSGKKVKSTSDNQWLAQCPAHPDGNPSLSIRRGRGMVLMFCFAGCSPSKIMSALSLRENDMFDNKRGVDYEYRHEGKVVRTVHRESGKKFRQSVVDGELVSLYIPPGLLLAEAIKTKMWVYLPEGEKDAETLWDIQIPAISSPMGAGSWAKCDYSSLKGARVRIVADKDEPGRKRADGLFYLLKTICDEVEVVEAKSGKDATDHILAGHSVDEFLSLEQNDEFEEAVQRETLRLEILAEARKRASQVAATLELVTRPLGDIIEMQAEYDWIVPNLLERKDRLILTGTEGSGKSVFLRQISVCIASGLHPFDKRQRIEPRSVVVVDAENTELQWARAARYITDLCRKVGTRDPGSNVQVAAGNRLDFTKQSDLDQVHKLIDTYKPDVLYIGPLYKLMPKEVSTDDDAAPLIMALDELRNRGVVLLMEAHAGHGKTNNERDLRPRGSSALMGWPEFGYGIRRLTDDGNSRLIQWRGDREQREWPGLLRRGVMGELPWERNEHLDYV